jgi:hypothetical protein
MGDNKTNWIDIDEWNFLEKFRHRQQCFLGYFGKRAIGLQDPTITEEEKELFNKKYDEEYGN